MVIKLIVALQTQRRCVQVEYSLNYCCAVGNSAKLFIPAREQLPVYSGPPPDNKGFHFQPSGVGWGRGLPPHVRTHGNPVTGPPMKLCL